MLSTVLGFPEGRVIFKNVFPFKNTRALFCFSSTIDENTNTVHLIERFAFFLSVKWEENNRLIDLKWALIHRKKGKRN